MWTTRLVGVSSIVATADKVSSQFSCSTLKSEGNDRSDALSRRDTSSIGQAMEFRIWTMLIEQSRGALHVFLPLLDRGLDGVVHRLTDGGYLPVQVKSRGSTRDSMVEIVIRGDSLVDDRALIIAGLHTAEDLGPTLLVVDEATYKRMAAHDLSGGKDFYSAAFSMRGNKGTHWRPYLVPSDRLAERLLGGPPPPHVARNEPTPTMDPSARHNTWLGFLGEQEVIRRLAENPRLDLFRPFPDLEMVEVLARDNETGGLRGDPSKDGGAAGVERSTLSDPESDICAGADDVSRGSGVAARYGHIRG